MIETLRRHRAPISLVVLLMVATAIYWLSAHKFDAGRPDLFYLADAFLHGRLWLERALGPYDVIVVGDRVFVPFAPFPAIALMPLVAVFGPDVVTQWQPLVNAALAAAGLGACWWMLARIGVASLADRLWLVALWGFSTAIWFTTTRGGVWHTGHLVASILTFAGLVELFGRRRPLVMGLLAGAAFLTRPPGDRRAPAVGLGRVPGGLAPQPARHRPPDRGRRAGLRARRALRALVQLGPLRKRARIRATTLPPCRPSSRPSGRRASSPSPTCR